jgi:hypothetical protein
MPLPAEDSLHMDTADDLLHAPDKVEGLSGFYLVEVRVLSGALGKPC